MITSKTGPDVVPARLGAPLFGRDESHTRHPRQSTNANAKMISDIFKGLCMSFQRSPQILASVKRFGGYPQISQRSLARNQTIKLRDPLPGRGSVG